MAKFLTTSGTSYYLEQLILNATSELVLVTPYLQLSPNFLERLRDADQKDIHITLIYGKNQLNQSEWYSLNELENMSILFCENLHAKCYQNDDSLIISSMNLYQFSQENNREMSILIDRNEDKTVYEEASKEIQSIINASDTEKSSGKMTGCPNQEIKVDPEYEDRDNFHIPYLYGLLEEVYSDTSFSIEEEPINSVKKIVAENFPIDGIKLEVEDRIFFHFDDEHQSSIWYDKKPLIFDNIPEAKIYVDRNRIKLYWRERTSTYVSD